MTKVTVNTTEEKTPEGVHNIGNWYKHERGDIYILSKIEGKVFLVNTSGCFWSAGISAIGVLTQEEFNFVCSHSANEFTLINNVEINIS